MVILATSENTEQTKVGNAFTVILISSGAFETIQSKTHGDFFYIIILHAHLVVLTIKSQFQKIRSKIKTKTSWKHSRERITHRALKYKNPVP